MRHSPGATTLALIGMKRLAMRVSINGEWQDLPDGQTVAELLAARRLLSKYVAVELNRQVAPRATHHEVRLKELDEVEIVTLVGGG